jgi:membrane-associated phospholipid phosphatase
LLQVPLAIAVWGVGAAAGSGRVAETGRDLLRAQISVVSWTYAIKIATQRTRPNGDPRSFPSGHASTSFATAMVLQDHFGWKAGVPAFAAAVYTAMSRVGANEHWASDVAFGAFVGIASARTVTIHLRDTRVSLAPLAVPGGGGVLVTALR